MISVKHLLRSWIRNKAFLTEILLIFAFGIGANVAVFGAYNAAFLQLPIADAGHILVLGETNRKLGDLEPLVSAPDFEDWRNATNVFEETALYDRDSAVVQALGIPRRVTVAIASENVFSILRTRPKLGGLFSASGENHEILISENLWKNTFDADPNVIGQSLQIGADVFVIRGVLSADFRLFEDVDIWERLQVDANEPRGGRYFIGLARLKSGRSVDEARAELTTVSQKLQKQYSDSNAGWEPSVMLLQSYLSRNLRSSFALLSLMAMFALAIAIFNATNLLGVYLHSRRKDQAVELALGSPRKRIRNRVLIEFLLLTIISAGLGLAVAYVAFKFIMQYAPDTMPPLRHYWSIALYGFAFLIALLSGAIAALMTLVSVSRTNLNGLLRDASAGLGARLGFHSSSRLLFLIFEVAVSVVLLTASGMLVKSFVLLQKVDMGFSPDNLLTAQIQLPSSRYDRSQQAIFWNRVITGFSELPGMKGVACITGAPLSGNHMNFRFQAGDGASGISGQAEYRAVSPDIFRLFQIPLRAGRPFNDQDRIDAKPVIIINETMARTFFRDQDPLGKHVILWYGDKKAKEIVGVVGDVKYSDLTQKPFPQVYVPYLQNPWPFMTLIFRTNIPPSNLAPVLHRELLKFDKEIPVDNVRTMDEIAYKSMAKSRFATVLIFSFAALSLALVTAGVYSVISFAVAQRSREIAIRIALGATRSSVAKLILSQSLTVIVIGTVFGWVIFLFSIQLLMPLLYKVHPVDIGVNFLTLCLIFGVGALASLFPAIKAIRIDPAMIMRSQ